MSGAQATPAAWLAVVYGHEGRILPMAMGESRQHAHAIAMRQFAGTTAHMQAHYAERIRYRALDADEASEMAEWFAAPWQYPMMEEHR